MATNCTGPAITAEVACNVSRRRAGEAYTILRVVREKIVSTPGAQLFGGVAGQSLVTAIMTSDNDAQGDRQARDEPR